MARDNPYDGLPKSAFWRSGVVTESPLALEGLYEPKFRITQQDRIATAGSCFAQHIARFLKARSFQVLDAEPPPRWLAEDLWADYGYATYSARYGNIYSATQLRQLVAEVLGEFRPQNFIWPKGAAVIDGLRPAVEPEGFASEDELRVNRAYHLNRVRALFQAMDVFVFTLGLTETWRDRASGTVFPTAPGVLGGRFDEDAFEFHNLTYGEVFGAMNDVMRLLTTLRQGRPLKIILTVSPVPLTATASGKHVISATAYSKAVLRAVAGDLAAAYDFVDYFPSYEMVTNPAARGQFFTDNLRTVRETGVQAVMAAFLRAHGIEGAEPATPALQPANLDGETAAFALEGGASEAQCEDALLEAFGG